MTIRDKTTAKIERLREKAAQERKTIRDRTAAKMERLREKAAQERGRRLGRLTQRSATLERECVALKAKLRASRRTVTEQAREIGILNQQIAILRSRAVELPYRGEVR